ncbi:hypothetical protein PUNSTDRAFT_132154 [Punctularia strigosozonata HHB-11173 SS5]|uniref:uncharacterized protein n=1 Tax=Punctularia strigosozonata (strain HHB-11173) TaxID=741275 RepID=UPI0004417A9D|nr:uncharacterized protein PUNSTDRAFT_132154 [Punctularia strigosozonata HHB-11173 SS5]EIN12022.1 hypothetical protein PUNSTDRAFT_132154 [Punctularia strigosozonata HHB-11173 SS5]
MVQKIKEPPGYPGKKGYCIKAAMRLWSHEYKYFRAKVIKAISKFLNTDKSFRGQELRDLVLVEHSVCKSDEKDRTASSNDMTERGRYML